MRHRTNRGMRNQPEWLSARSHALLEFELRPPAVPTTVLDQSQNFETDRYCTREPSPTHQVLRSHRHELGGGGAYHRSNQIENHYPSHQSAHQLLEVQRLAYPQISQLR